MDRNLDKNAVIHFRTNVSRERIMPYNYLIKSKRVIRRVNNFDTLGRNVQSSNWHSINRCSIASV